MIPDPSLLLGPCSFKVANNGKYITEKETSLNIVAPVPLYNPTIPCCLNNRMVSSVAEVLTTVLPAENYFKNFMSEYIIILYSLTLYFILYTNFTLDTRSYYVIQKMWYWNISS